MANPAVTIKYGQQQLLIGDGATPTEAFSAPCGITSLTKTTAVATNTVNIPDCDDPDLASFLGIDEVSRQISIQFSGVLATQYLPEWQSWDLTGGYKNIRWYRDLSAASGGGYLQGPALLTAFEEAAEAKGRYTVSGTVTFDGQPTWVPAT